ncbi:MAG: Digeranylgeranylglycerophospholipid reductase [Promethearchaeota archaeon]|nr:MAG: Digeranylgeranylglycerophospholipid reductase [Candidatus Lokiarchaeota archaeon]
MNSSKKYDVVVVGAGTGGTTAARFCAKKGLEVCLIDTKEKEKIGNKICGDAVGNEIFDMLNIPHPKGEELSCHITGAKLYPPNRKKCLTLIDPKQAGYVVHRLEFGQRLLNEALDAGVNEFKDKTIATDLIYKNGVVHGVKVKGKDGQKIDLKSSLVIDASGLHSPLRKKIKSEIIEKEISKDDEILCFREIIEFPKRDQEVMDKDYITIILDPSKAPGGYMWYFPKNDYSINMGLGTYMHFGGKVKDYYKQYMFNEFIETSNYKIISSGGGIAPVRRPMWSCADDGIIFIGDAAFQVNPLHGGGIDSSMRAGYYAAETASEALEKGDISLKSLWSYNHKVMSSFGAEFAALDLLRRVLQVLTPEELNFGLEKELLSGAEILQIAATGGINLSIMDFASKAFKGLSKPNLMLDLNYLRIRMNEISELYKKFPMDKSKFEAWKFRVQEIYNKIDRMIIQPKKPN